jgi:integral membrane sensor domain MASE1
MPPNYISKVALLAGLYVLTGLLGLQLAIPPGYSTIIWPASGIAIGMLLVHGARLWPGILLGSFAVNAYHGSIRRR